MQRSALQAHPEFDGHEEIIPLDAPEVGLAGFIAIHSTALGPSAGGCRFTHYASPDAALVDVLRLSRGMSYKSAMARLPLGGGKAVLYGSPSEGGRAKMFEALGEAIDRLDGRYVTAEDVGVGERDIQSIHARTNYVTGLPPTGDIAGGSPSDWTALGVFLAIQSLLGGSFRSRTIAIQGAGAVGLSLTRRLIESGAHVVVADMNASRNDAASAIGAKIASTESIFDAPADVFAPCALGATLNPHTIPRLRAKIICGAANNQLASAHDDTLLRDHGITYAPDYIVNAGGIINVAAEYLGQSFDFVDTRVRSIPERLTAVLDRAAAERRTTSAVADEMARNAIRRRPT